MNETIVRRYPDAEQAALVARGEADGDIGTAAVELAVELTRLREECGTLRGRLADARDDRRAAWAAEHELRRELVAVLGEVRAMLDGPDHVRSAAARLLRKRLPR